MMQQPTQEQAMSQQQAAAAAQQQMVLCPVRVVYETQILMPPGEQMNPNQTFYINPQNQPPWATQSPQIYPQNQMLYVQNMPQNIVPSMQQHMDPNQMYIQQTYPAMQQILQNQNMPMLAQNLQERQVLRQPVQFANVPQNMNVINVNQFGQMVNMQNVASIPQNVPNIVQAPNINQSNVQMVQQNQTNSPKPPDVQQSVQNINFAQNIIQNQNMQRAQMVQQQFRIMQQQIVNAQQNAGNQTAPKVVQNAQPNPVQMPNQIVTNPIPQQPQQHRMVVQQNVRQTFVQNVPQQTITQNQNLPNQTVQNVQRNVANTYTQQHPNVYIRQTATVDPSQYNQVNQTTVSNAQQFNQVRPVNNKVAIPNQVQQNTAPNVVNPPIRPRGPRPMATQTQVKIMPNQQNQQARSMPQLRTMALQPNPMMQMQNMTTQMQKPQQKPICNVASQATNPPKPMQVSVATETMSRTPGIDNRKRKSESPDEAKHKIAAIEANKATYGNHNTYLVNRLKEVKSLVNEVGVTPESVHKAHIKISYPGAQGTLDNSVQTESNHIRKPNATITSQDLIGEKLKRNTVFGQARVRNVSNENKTIEPMNELPTLPITAMEVVTDATIVKPEEKRKDIDVKQPVQPVVNNINQVKIKEEPSVKTPKEEKKEFEIKTNVKPDIKPDVKAEIKPDVKPIIKSDVKPVVKPVLQPEIVDEKIQEKKEEDKKPQKSESKTELSQNALSEKIRNFSGKQIELSHGNIHKRDGNENNYILTHVLDGIVIQESNVAFPIRLPLKERIIPNAAVKTAEAPAKVLEVPTKVLEVPVKLADASTAEVKQEITIKLKGSKEEPSKSSETNILTISELHLNEGSKNTEECEDSKSKDTNENPLHCSKPHVVKSWTSEELADRLSKGGWHETASILLEHEIDGESLFLVSNAQLLKIGIDEGHATILSDFINS